MAAGEWRASADAETVTHEPLRGNVRPHGLQLPSATEATLSGCLRATEPEGGPPSAVGTPTVATRATEVGQLHSGVLGLPVGVQAWMHRCWAGTWDSRILLAGGSKDGMHCVAAVDLDAHAEGAVILEAQDAKSSVTLPRR